MLDDAALPVGRAAHRAPEGLLGGRRDRALPPPQRPPRAAPDGLRRLRPARREPRDQDRPAPARVHRGVDRGVPPPVPRLGHLDRLDARVRHPRAALLPLDPVDLPAAVRAGPRLPQGGRRQLVPQGRHRARERAGDRRPLRALRHRGRGQRELEQWFFRITDYADRLLDDMRDDRVAPARGDDAATTGSAAPRAPRSSSAARSWAPTTRCSPPARTRCSAPPSSSWPPSTPTCSA